MAGFVAFVLLQQIDLSSPQDHKPRGRIQRSKLRSIQLDGQFWKGPVVGRDNAIVSGRQCRSDPPVDRQALLNPSRIGDPDDRVDAMDQTRRRATCTGDGTSFIFGGGSIERTRIDVHGIGRNLGRPQQGRSLMAHCDGDRC